LPDVILQQPAAKIAASQFVQPPVAQMSWYHLITLLEKVQNFAIREFYLQKTIQNGWSRDVMAAQIRIKLHLSIGNAISNFDSTLPSVHSDLARETLKNP